MKFRTKETKGMKGTKGMLTRRVKNLLPLLALLLLAFQSSIPDGKIVDVTTQGIDLQFNPVCEYNVYVSHAETEDECRWWPPYSTQVLTLTQVSRLSIAWDETGLGRPSGGDWTCVWWDCKPEPAYLYLRLLFERIKSKAFLPLVVRDP